MIQLLKRMRRREALMALLCAVLVVGQVYFDLRLPDYMTELTKLIKTPGSSTGDILSVGGEMLLCTLCSAVLAVGCGYLSARTAAGFSFSVRRDLFHHVMDAGSEEMQTFSVPSLITRTTNDITQIQMIVAMGLQMLMKAPIMAVWAVIKILGKSWTLSAVTAGFVVALVALVLLIMSSCLPRFRRVQKKTDEINRVARENLTGINVVHAFGAEDYQNKKFDGPSRDMMDLQLKNQRLFALLQPAMGLGMNGLALAIYWVGAALVESIARALARRPEILIFDDSFSALDYKTDATLREGLAKQLPGTTKIIVAQRISTIRHADQILVLDRGEIAGLGTHDALMTSCPVYREIAMSQLSEEELKKGGASK